MSSSNLKSELLAKMVDVFSGGSLSISADMKAVKNVLENELNQRQEADRITVALAEEGKRTIEKNIEKLISQTGGKAVIKSAHGGFMRAHEHDWTVDMAKEPRAWESWFLENYKGKMVFKAIHTPVRYMRAYPDGKVDLASSPENSEMWLPFKNDNGSWSFLSAHGQWLSANQNGSMRTVEVRGSWEQFWIGLW